MQKKVAVENYTGKKIRIGILGLGGVGGYLGAKLAAANLPGNVIIFIAHNKTKQAIANRGLKFITDNSEVIVHPHLVSDDSTEIGRLDVLICTVKGYDLEQALNDYKACFDVNTVILPFLNGIDISARISKIIPGSMIWPGCIYIVARQQEPGVIRQSGEMRRLYFGIPGGNNESVHSLQRLFEKADISCEVSDDIQSELWKKFIFISVTATFTAYYFSGIGLAQRDPHKAGEIKELVQELINVAVAKGVNLPANIGKETYNRIISLNPEATTSMYADFERGGPTELEELTGDVVRLGAQYRVPTPIYEKMYRKLSGKVEEQKN